MSVDYNKFAFSKVENPHAATLTEAIAAPPVANGYVVITLKTGQGLGFASAMRAFATTLRAEAASSGMTDILAFREADADELGGPVPFEQAIFDKALADAKRRHASDTERWKNTGLAVQQTTANDIADWVVFIEFASTTQAAAAAARWKGVDAGFAALVKGVAAHSVNSFENMMRYADVSRDPNLIQFFNFFPGPGDRAQLWAAWQDALPYFIEFGSFLSSFPLLALDPDQKLLLVNYAHVDTVKPFFLAVCYDPNFFETVMSCYASHGFHLPSPFFCKIVPV